MAFFTPKTSTKDHGVSKATPLDFMKPYRGEKCIIRVAAVDTIDLDMTSKSDPYCILKLKEPSKPAEVIGITEVIKDKLSPKFCTPLFVNKKDEVEQKLIFELYDKDSAEISQPMGRTETTLQLLHNMLKFESEIRPIKNEKVKGKMIVYCEKLKEVYEDVHLSFKLPKKISRIKIDMEINDLPEDNWVRVYKMANPSTNEKIKLSMTQLANGYYSRKLCFTFVHKLKNNVKEKRKWTTTPFEMINREELSSGLSQENYIKCRVSTQHNFDIGSFLSKGTKLKVTLGVDFSVSNKDVTDSESLHYYTPTQPISQYNKVINFSMTALQEFADGNKITVKGTGAKLKDESNTSFNFAMNFNEDDPTVIGVEGVVTAYQNCVKNIKFSNPSNFTSIIEEVADNAAKSTKGTEYHIAVIITDGAIDDMKEIKETVVNKSGNPWSVIFIVVGKNDNMKCLNIINGDKGHPRASGVRAVRDIVHCVKFDDFCNDKTHDNFVNEMIKEIPEQVVAYMDMNDIEPSIVEALLQSSIA